MEITTLEQRNAEVAELEKRMESAKANGRFYIPPYEAIQAIKKFDRLQSIWGPLLQK